MRVWDYAACASSPLDKSPNTYKYPSISHSSLTHHPFLIFHCSSSECILTPSTSRQSLPFNLRLHRARTSMEFIDPAAASESDDDMSAGARLMRYNVSDGPRLECRSFDLGLRRRSSNSGSLQRTTNDLPMKHDLPYELREAIRHGSSWTVNSESHGRSSSGGFSSDLDRFPEDPPLFYGSFTELEAYIPGDIAGCKSNQRIMLKISTFRPQALPDRARLRGISKQKTKLVLDALRTRRPNKRHGACHSHQHRSSHITGQ